MTKSAFYLLIFYLLLTGHLLAHDSELQTKEIYSTNLSLSDEKSSSINNEKLIRELSYSNEVFHFDPTDFDKQTLTYLNIQLERSRSTANVGASIFSVVVIALIIDVFSLGLYGEPPFMNAVGPDLYGPLIGGLIAGSAGIYLFGSVRARYYNDRINELQSNLNSSIFIIPPHWQNFSNNYSSFYTFGLGIKITL